MAAGQLLQAVRALADDQSDGQLLRHFVARRDEAAFEALVRRHGPMVLGVCRRVLGNAADAEDAFQATFLVLVRKAASLTGRAVVGDWLHGVARRTALNARGAAARRRAKEQAMARPETQGDEVREDWLPVLDEELSRLPEKYRLPLVLCELEGETRREAAERLGWPEGTVAGRLARARALLAQKLARRGLAMSAAALTAALAPNAASAALPAALVATTVKAAAPFAAGSAAAASAKAAALADGVLKGMLLTKLKTATTALLMVGLAVFTCGVLAEVLPGGRGEGGKAAAAAEAPPEAVKGLSARLVVRSKLPLRGEELRAELVLTNQGDQPLRLSTLCSRLADGGPGWGGVTFRPDFWRADPPTPEQSARRMVALRPGDSVTFAIEVGRVRGAEGKFTLRAAYEVGDEFARRHDAWAGRVEARPVVIPLDEAPKRREDDYDRLQGTWRVTALESDGLRSDEGRPEVKGSKAIVAGNSLTMIDWRGRTTFEFQLDPTARPKEIVLTVPGQFQLRGIYTLDGDDFRLCFARAGEAKAPTEFTAAYRSGRWLYTFRRQRPEEDGGQDAPADKGKADPPVRPPSPPEDARRLVEDFEREAQAIQEEVDRQIKEKKDKLIGQLKELQDGYTRPGKLDEALAIRDRIRLLKASAQEIRPDPGTLGGYRAQVGQTFVFEVVGRTDGVIWGSGVYTDDSPLATVAVHAGALKDGQKGLVRVTILPGEMLYVGSTSNGVTSNPYGEWPGCYRVEPVKE
jgi:RNA polymerase sigma factor (sigma-70 family)